MSRSLRGQLFINEIVILLLGMGLAGFLFWQAAETMYLDTQRENLLAQAQLSADLLCGKPLPAAPVGTYSQVSNIAPGLHTRVLSQQGSVVIGLPETSGNTPVQMPAAEDNALVHPQELRSRPEILSALQGNAATAVRSVTSANRRVLYAAAPIYAEDGTIRGLVYIAEPLPAGGLPEAFHFQVGLATLATVILALVAGTLLARRVTRPVAAFIQGAEAVGDGHLDQTVPESSGIHELDRLGQTFNRMASNLKRSDQAQSAFVADVAHELRTPLTVIKGTIETLEDGALDDMEGRGFLLTSMEKETDRLIRLVNNLLTLTRADAGMLKLDLHPLDIASLAKERCDRFTPLAAVSGVKLAVEPDGAFRVSGDEDRLSQVLDNLLDNAIRYTSSGSVVRVNISRQDNEIICRVCDSGQGIPAEKLSHVFSRFYRADASRSHQEGGAGLGLSIVQALVQANGGQVFAESTPGKGAEIGFSLPVLPEN